MRAARLATVAVFLLFAVAYTPAANSQVLFTTGVGVCKECGHSELDTQRYINSFLNQLFFPESGLSRTAIAASLYTLTATYTIYGRLSPDPNHSSVTIAITAEVKAAIPTGRYHVSVTTPAGTTQEKTYPIGSEPFSVTGEYAPGAKRKGRRGSRDKRIATGGSGSGPAAQGGYSPAGWISRSGGGGRGPASCSRSRMEARGNETIVYCSVD